MYLQVKILKSETLSSIPFSFEVLKRSFVKEDHAINRKFGSLGLEYVTNPSIKVCQATHTQLNYNDKFMAFKLAFVPTVKLMKERVGAIIRLKKWSIYNVITYHPPC